MREHFLLGLSFRFRRLSPAYRQVAYVLLTRPPLYRSSSEEEDPAPLDLHVLGTPPAFVLSQDQTLHEDIRLERLPSGFI